MKNAASHFRASEMQTTGMQPHRAAAILSVQLQQLILLQFSEMLAPKPPVMAM